MTKEDYDRLCPRPDPNPPDPDKPLNPLTHPADYLFALTHGYRRDNPPKHIPDRRWEEDFGNPRRIPRHLLTERPIPFTETQFLLRAATPRSNPRGSY